ncbi:MAG: hypothetical protein HLUCCA08_04370 [Rhodobacteraceae bacterium HLUCCA08]|nr:MAG: hypothetical protein HLUCCA08_04370 [Rhodobacteraceae bacterium HLUCCA08]
MVAFLLALVAGFVTPALDGAISRPLARSLSRVIAIEDRELRLVSFLIALLAVGLFCAIFDTGSVLGVASGMILGYFALRLSTALRAALDRR